VRQSAITSGSFRGTGPSTSRRPRATCAGGPSLRPTIPPWQRASWHWRTAAAPAPPQCDSRTSIATVSLAVLGYEQQDRHREAARAFLAFAVLLVSSWATAQTPFGTAFTYQGRLTDAEAPANGSYDLEFKLFDAASGGSQVGSTVTLGSVGVTNGLFTVSLDFGTGVFAGNRRWLEMGVRPGGTGGAFTTLVPRQQLTAGPNTIFALAAASATTVAGLTCSDGQVVKWSGTSWTCRCRRGHEQRRDGDEPGNGSGTDRRTCHDERHDVGCDRRHHRQHDRSRCRGPFADRHLPAWRAAPASPGSAPAASAAGEGVCPGRGSLRPAGADAATLLIVWCARRGSNPEPRA
jgi:hypothetical protein